MSMVGKLFVWGLPGVKDYISKKLRWRRLAKELRQISQLDKDATPERGVTLIGDLFQGASNSKTNRDFAHALKDAGIPFQTFSTDRTVAVPECDYADILTPRSEFRLHRYTHVIEMFRSPLPRELVRNRARIAFWEGEHGILDVWPFLSGDDPVIGMSDFNVKYFKREFKAPVYKILYPLRKIDVDIRMGMLDRIDAFGNADQAYELDLLCAPVLDHVDRRNRTSACRKHRIDNHHDRLIEILRELREVFLRFKGFLIPEETDESDLGGRHQPADSVQQADPGS